MSDVIDRELEKEFVVLKEATPKPKKHRFHGNNPNQRVEAHKHPNGGGWVANTAKVAPSVYVSSTSEVFDYAEINGHVIIRGKCRIFGNARIDGDITILGHVIIQDNVRISGRATIDGRIDIKNAVCVYGTSSIRGEVILNNNAVINESVVAGWGSISDRVSVFSSTLNGDFCLCNHVAVNTSTLIGRFMLGGSATICASRVTNTMAPHSRFYRKKLRKASHPPPTRDLNSVELPHDTNCVSTHVDVTLRSTNVLRGRTTITGSDVYAPVHCACSVALNKITLNPFGAQALVIYRPITVTEGYFSPMDLRSMLANETNTRNFRPQNTAPHNNAPNPAQPAAPSSSAVAVFDPRGSRVIRV